MTFRTLVMALACLVAAFALMAFAPPKPRVTGTGAVFTIAPDSTVRAQARVTLTGQLRPGDQIRYKFRKDGVVIHNVVEPGLTSSVYELPAPAYGATAAYDACARAVYANGTQGTEKCSPAWTYTRPDLPAPEVETVEILPASVGLSYFERQQFCGAARLSDGTYVLGSTVDTIPFCRDALAARMMGL